MAASARDLHQSVEARQGSKVHLCELICDLALIAAHGRNSRAVEAERWCCTRHVRRFIQRMVAGRFQAYDLKADIARLCGGKGNLAALTVNVLQRHVIEVNEGLKRGNGVGF